MMIPPDHIFRSGLLTSYNEAPQLHFQSVLGDGPRAWHGGPPHGLGMNQYTNPNTLCSHEGMPSPHALEPQFMSNLHPPVHYPDYWPANAGYHTNPAAGTQYGTPFTISAKPMALQTNTGDHPLLGLGSASGSVVAPHQETSFVPVVRCMVDNCGEEISVKRTILQAHLASAHGYGTLPRSHSVICRWSGCMCTRQDIVEHVWQAHLDFQDVCGKCGDAGWNRRSSFQRHTRKCIGRKPARCKGCCHFFRSTIALAGHIELGQCEAALFG
jgi:hypothetical protein